MLFKNFMAASRKRNLARFGLFWNIQDTSWIDDAPMEPATEVSAIYNSVMVIDTSTGDVITVTLTGNVTSTTLNYDGGAPTTGTTVTLRIVENATGGWTFALPANLQTDQGFGIDTGANRVTLLPIRFQTDHWEFWTDPISFPLTGV